MPRTIGGWGHFDPLHIFKLTMTKVRPTLF